MMPIRSILSASLIAALGACAAKSAGSTASGPAQWTGSFRQSQSATSGVVGPATPGKGAAYGSITLTPQDGTPPATKIELSISTPSPSGTQIAWAVFSGPCGSTAPPVAGPQEFPTIEVASSGGGFVRTSMRFVLEPRSAYHANVYWSSQVSDVSNVMMCANLTAPSR